MKKNVGQKIISIFMFLFGLNLLLITGICMTKPQHNLIPGRIFLYTCIWMILLAAIRIVLLWIEKRTAALTEKDLRKFSIRVFWICNIILGIILFIVGCVGRIQPHTDYENVYRAAEQLALGTEVDNWYYFARCTNNRFVMLWLSMLLKAGYGIGLADGFYLALLVQVIHVMLTIWCVYYLAGKSAKHWFANAWMAVAMYVMLTPIWGNIAIFYSDQCSFGFGVMAFTLYYKAVFEEREKRTSLLLALAAGIVWGIGFNIKVTVAISLIALLFVVLFNEKRKAQIRNIAVLFVGFAVVVVISGLVMKSLPCEKDIEKYSDPILYWVALGLNGSGNYADNIEFAQICVAAEDVHAKKEIVMQKLADDWRNFFDASHLVSKTRMNFGCGDLGACGYMTFPYNENNIVYRLFSYDGDWFWKYACVSTSYLFAIFGYAIIGAFRLAFCKEVDEVATMSYIAICGIMIFLMLWEAQNKQLYNHSAWLILAALCGVKSISGMGRGKDKLDG